MVPPSRRSVLKRIGVVSSIAVAGCSGVPGPAETPTDPSTDQRRPLSLAMGGAKCHDDVDSFSTGWVHTVAHGESYDLTFDAILGHDAGMEPTASLVPTAGDDYELQFSTKSGESPEKTPRESSCLFGTQVTGGGSLPSGFQRLDVVAGGETVLTVEREGTFAELHRLPTPVPL